MTNLPTTPSPLRSVISRVGLFAGPLLAILSYLSAPDRFASGDGSLTPFTPEGHLTLGLMVWMAVWWMTEAIDLQATALLPLAVLPLGGALTINDVASPYASPLIFLFMGGFLLALSMQRWGLDRRIALRTLRVVGTRPAHLIGGLMIATAVMSATVSNTATVAMMLPIGLSVVSMLGEDGESARAHSFRTSLLLSLAYAASIGGLATLIGSPPNGFLAQFCHDELGITIGFAEWLAVGLPVTLILLPLTWWLLTRVFFQLPREELAGGREWIQSQFAALGPMQRGEWVTFLVFTVTVVCWITRPLLARVVPGLTDPGIAITAGLLLFVLPVDLRRGVFAMNWDTAKKLPWGILVLFGGGLSLAHAISTTGVGEFIGSATHALGGSPPLLLALGVTVLMIFLTELTSNTATAATLIPLLTSLAPGLGVSAALLILPATLAASCAFMLPVATPPNAIVFSSGYISIPQMCRVGLWLNLIAAAVITALLYFVTLPILGLA